MKSLTSSELSMIKGYLFRGGLTDYSPLHQWEAGTKSRHRKREAGCVLYISIYSVRGQAQVGG